MFGDGLTCHCFVVVTQIKIYERDIYVGVGLTVLGVIYQHILSFFFFFLYPMLALW